MSELTTAEVNLANQKANDASKTIFGFWVYLMTDCVLFAGLFASYAVLHNNTFGGPDAKELFSLPYVLTETMILLISSYTCGLAILAVKRNAKTAAMWLLALTFCLGLAFLTMELTEFRHLIQEGNSWRRSGFLSSYFTLVGIHGIHITIGLIWIGVMITKIRKFSLNEVNVKRLSMMSLFWHFLDVIWIFIFTIVYLMGALKV